jgi:RNA polymerase sigma factor (TIGR02999 family)
MAELLPLVYADLRHRARRYVRRERSGHTLQPTALVHEAFLKLVDQREVTWQNRSHFFAVASSAMRRILVDYARTHRRAKRGGGRPMDLLTESIAAAAVEIDQVDVIALDNALTRLGERDARQAHIVELRYFGGLSIEETAVALGISVATVNREWKMARAWLFAELGGLTRAPESSRPASNSA